MEQKKTSTFGNRRKLFLQQLNRTFPAECHCLMISPSQVLRNIVVEFFKTAEMLPVIKISLVISVTSLYFSILPWCHRRYQLMLYTCIFERCIKRTFRIITYVFVCEFCSVVCLNCLYLEGKFFLQHIEKLHCIFRCVLFKAIYEPISGTFIYCRPLIQMFAVSL